MQTALYPISVMALALASCGNGAEQSNARPADGGPPINVIRPIEAAAGESAVTASPTPAAQAEGAPGNDGGLSSVTEAVRAVFAPYLAEGIDAPSAFDSRPSYSDRLNFALGQWRRAIAGNDVTDLSSVDWLCSCQDWHGETARLAIEETHATSAGYDVHVRYSPGFGERGEPLILVMIEEGGRWRVDDARFATGPSLRAQLAAETRSGGN